MRETAAPGTDPGESAKKAAGICSVNANRTTPCTKRLSGGSMTQALGQRASVSGEIFWSAI